MIEILKYAGAWCAVLSPLILLVLFAYKDGALRDWESFKRCLRKPDARDGGLFYVPDGYEDAMMRQADKDRL
jgi:hypothetical protein